MRVSIDRLHEFKCIDTIIDDVKLTKRQREYYEVLRENNYNQSKVANVIGINIRNSKKMMKRVRDNVKEYLDLVCYTFIDEPYIEIDKSVICDMYASGLYTVRQISEIYDVEHSLIRKIIDDNNITSPTFSRFGKIYTIDDIRESFEAKGYKLLTKEYVNAIQQLEFECSVGHRGSISHVMWQRNKIACSECSGIPGGLGAGNYTLERAGNNKEEWINKKAYVYIIELSDELEKFYKIGISVNYKNRFGNFPYNVKEVEIIETNLYDACFIEKELHRQHSQFGYKPKKDFGGYTECFSEIVL